MSGQAGSQIEDDKQEYQFSMPWVTPSGHEFSFYDTKDNQRLVLKHTSGSRIEFKTDGSIFMKAIKDFHFDSSVASSQQPGAGGGAGAGGGDNTTMRFEADLAIEVEGTFRIKANKIEIDSSETTKMISGTDTVITANNIIEKANENVAIEATKSVYVDCKDYRERSVSHQVEEGTQEAGGGAPGGGINHMNVTGHFVIDNTDPKGSITIKSAGYLNLVCGQERVDIVGKYIPTPSALALGTFTTQVFIPTPPAPMNKSVLGDYIFNSQGGASYTYALTTPSSMIAPGFGLNTIVTTGNANRLVMVGNDLDTVTVGNQACQVGAGNRTRLVGGNEVVTIAGIQKVTAAKIFLN